MKNSQLLKKVDHLKSTFEDVIDELKNEISNKLT